MSEAESSRQVEPDTHDGPVVEHGPGRQLREAREAAGLSRDEVAAQLRLRVGLVTALEEDDVASLPPAAFVNGYIRSYARLLNRSADEFLQAVSEREGAGESVATIMPPPQHRSSDWPVKLLTWLIILGLLGLLAAWWVSRQPLESNIWPGDKPAKFLPEDEDAPVFSARADGPEDSATNESGMVDEDTAQFAAGSAGQKEGVANEFGRMVDERDAAGPDNETAMPGEELEIRSGPLPGIPAGPVLAGESAEKPAAVADGEPADNGDTGVLRIVAHDGDCWITVSDAEGKRLISNLLKNGQSRTVEGTGPFHVTLGNAAAVTVYYQEEIFDLTPYNDRNIARFTVGGEAGSASTL